MNMLKRLIKERGRMIPINTIGLATNKLGQRFLNRLSTSTGGYFQEFDMKWRTRTPLYSNMDVNDIVWAQTRIEAEQRQNIENGKNETIDDIIKRVKDEFQFERGATKLAHFKEEEARRLREYEILLNNVKITNRNILREV